MKWLMEKSWIMKWFGDKAGIRIQASWDPACSSRSCPALTTDTPRTQILVFFSVGPGHSVSPGPASPLLTSYTISALHSLRVSQLPGLRTDWQVIMNRLYFLIVLGLLTQIKEKSSLFFFSKANEVSKWIESVLEWGGLHSWKRLFKQKCHSSAPILL